MGTHFRLLSFSFLLALTPLWGQADQENLVTRDLIRIDAIVIDSDGNHVADLTPEEFQLNDSGKRQEITSVEYVSTGSVPTASVTPSPDGHPGAPQLTEASQVRRSILFMVNTTVAPTLLPDVKEMLTNFVNTQMQSGDLAAIRTSSGDQSVLGEFTSDRNRLRAMIDRVAWTAVAEPMLPVVNNQALLNAFTEIKGKPGRKAVVYVSSNLIWPVPALATANARNRAINASHNQITDMALRAGAVFYLLDPSGPGQLSGEIEPEKLTSSTGGLWLRGSKDLSSLVAKLLDNMNGYYEISYQPSHEFVDAEKDTFHELRVRINHRGASVRSRSGYYEVSETPAEEPAPGDERLRAALFSTLSTDAIRYKITPVLVAGGDAGQPTVLRTLFAVDPSSIPFEDQAGGTKSARIDLLAFAFAADGTVAGRNSVGFMLNLSPEQLSAMEGKSLAYQVGLQISEPGPYVVKTVVADGSVENVGSAQMFVDVPDLGGGNLTLAGLLAVEDGLDPQPASQGAVVEPGNSIDRVFQAGTSVHYVSSAFGGGSSLQSQVHLYRDNERVFSSEPAAVAGGTLDGTIALPENLEAGDDYALELVASESLSDAQEPKASEWATFTID